ncbi:multicopper oxidase, partial [Backusella circina FSU 941]
ESGLINDDANTTFSFEPNKTYRLRILNIGGIATFNVYIDGHEMEVIEQDGVLTKPTHVKGVYLAAGQRLSVLVHSKPTTDTNYRFHANMNPAMFDYVPDDLELKIQAPIYYNRSHEHFGEIEDPKTKEGYSDAVIPSYAKMETLSPQRQINLTITFELNTDGLSHGSINNVPYLTPFVPTLHTLLTVGDLANNPKVYGPQTNVYLLEKDQVVELVINNIDDGPHPFHLHGHYFQVIGRGSGVFHKDARITPEPKYPTVRDTIVTTPNGYVVLRFKADNPGAWIFHCHLDWHLPAGLAVIFIDAVEEARQQTLPQAYIDLCHNLGLPGTGNAAGKEGLDLEGAPDGVRPIKETFVLGCIIATLVGLSTLIWHVWVDPGTSEDEEEEDQAPLMKGETQ